MLAKGPKGPLPVQNISEAEARKTAAAVLAEVGLLCRANCWPAHVFGSQQHRVAMDPDAMRFDEPTPALDPALTGAGA